MSDSHGDEAPTPLLARIRRKAAQQCVPLHAMIELTHRCNLSCRHCYVVPKSDGNELSLDDIRRILDQLADAGCLFLILSGGEPLLREDFLPIAAYARQKGFAFVLFTNGTRVTADLAAALFDLCVRRVEISLLGGKPETHDAITGVAGSFREAIKGAELLLARSIAVQLKTTWMRPNIEEAPLLESLAREMGAQFRSGHALVPRWDNRPVPADLQVTRSQLTAHVRRQLGGGPYPEPAAVPKERRKDIIPCGAGRTSCVVDAHGRLLPCVVLRTPVGDLRKGSFQDIWQSSPELKHLRSIRLADLPDCSGCNLFTRCSRCAGIARLETGSLLNPSRQACNLARLVANECMQWVAPRCPV